MVDTKNPLRVASTAEAYERADYWKSWAASAARGATK
jgi:hypothetical protein